MTAGYCAITNGQSNSEIQTGTVLPGNAPENWPHVNHNRSMLPHSFQLSHMAHQVRWGIVIFINYSRCAEPTPTSFVPRQNDPLRLRYPFRLVPAQGKFHG